LFLAKCDVCGKTVELPYKCHYCGGVFCAEHHLPENHNCQYKPQEPPPYIQEALYEMIIREEEDEIPHEIERARKIQQTTVKKEKRRLNVNKIMSTILVLLCVSLLTVVYLLYVSSHNNTASNNSPGLIFIPTDVEPPTIIIISPEAKIYNNTDTIALNYTVNEPPSWMGYSLNNKENVTLTSNITLSNLSLGRYHLIIYANDTAGNMGASNVSFTITRLFGSVDELIDFLVKDDLNNEEWTSNYTCVEFAEDFIERAEAKGYYCFTQYDLFDDELVKFNKAIESIKVTKTYPWGTETRWYFTFYIPSVGHAVVKTTINGMDVIVDPQTDIILSYPDFKVLYEGEITQE